MKSVLTFIIVLLVVYLTLSLINKFKKDKKTTEVMYIVNRFNLNTNKIKYYEILRVITIIESIMLSIVVTVVENIDSFILEVMVALILMLGLTFISFELLGKYYVKKGYSKRKEVK